MTASWRGALIESGRSYGESKATARWLAADGTPGAATFSIAGWKSNVPEHQGAGRWKHRHCRRASERRVHPELARRHRAGETVERPAPSWLAARGNFLLLPEGKAMAFGTEVLAGDGTVCGTVDLGAPLSGSSRRDGVRRARPETFRIYPQLFR